MSKKAKVTQQFDKLNLLSMATEWFSKVEVSEEEKKKRALLALDYCDIIIMLFLMITEQEYEREECIKFAEERLRILAERELGRESIAYINEWAKIKAVYIVDETYEKLENEIEDISIEEEEAGKDNKDPTKEKILNFEEEGVQIPESEYWTSNFRALKIGIELSTTVYNFKELSDAIDAGKTRKVWMTESDDRVRETHDAIHGVDIPINEFFTVGVSSMLMPGDIVHGAELKEICNCRCHLVCY